MTNTTIKKIIYKNTTIIYRKGYAVVPNFGGKDWEFDTLSAAKRWVAIVA